MNIVRFSLLLFIVASAAPSTAGAGDTLFNQVHLKVEAAREIPNDELTLLLIAEAEGEDPARIAALTELGGKLQACRNPCLMTVRQ